MARNEHLLTIVEPRPGGDSTLDLAHETVERGGTANVVMLITERVQRDIRDFARSEELDLGVAEALALEQLRTYYATRVGGTPTVEVHFGDLAEGLRDYVTADTTAIAMPQRLTTRRARRMAKKAGIPVHITPDRAA